MASTDNMIAAEVADQQNSTTATIPETIAVQEHGHTCDDPTHHHDEQPNFFNANDLFSTLNAAKTEQPAKRKAKKNRQQNAVRAENIPGNRGDENIDDLVNFINSPPTKNEKKQKKKATTAATN